MFQSPDSTSSARQHRPATPAKKQKKFIQLSLLIRNFLSIDRRINPLPTKPRLNDTSGSPTQNVNFTCQTTRADQPGLRNQPGFWVKPYFPLPSLIESQYAMHKQAA
ncbi:hypothetical protein TWF718_000283 [Orbilia javanica]|uniref:Uncharacterized protein n=1 Tax=Orbilia javanica TaxID=47235 RepID=A0AAN8RFR5_9PEZI